MAKQYGKWRVVDSTSSSGGQAVVLKVEDPSQPGEYFALKRLSNAKRIDRFRKEIKVISELDHPGIVKLVDSSLESQPYFYVMPFFRRGSLAALDLAKMTIEARLELFALVLDALIAAHAKDVVHRDIKPENILIADDGRPVIADFGICYFEDGCRVTLHDEAVGPRNYIAPELEGGILREVRPDIDVYAAGKLLYYLLAGRDLPRERHREDAFNLVSVLQDHRCEIVNRFLDKAVNVSPPLRFPDAAFALKEFRMLQDDWPRVVNVPSPNGLQRCVYCGIGHYRPLGVDPQQHDGRSSNMTLYNEVGIQPTGNSRIRILRCDTCANLQLFGLNEFDRRQNSQAGQNPWARGPVPRSS